MLQQSRRLLFYELRDHVAEHRSHSVKPLICSAYVVETMIVEKNLLHDEYSNCLAQFRSSLHDTKAEGDNLGGEEKVDDLG